MVLAQIEHSHNFPLYRSFDRINIPWAVGRWWFASSAPSEVSACWWWKCHDASSSTATRGSGHWWWWQGVPWCISRSKMVALERIGRSWGGYLWFPESKRSWLGKLIIFMFFRQLCQSSHSYCRSGLLCHAHFFRVCMLYWYLLFLCDIDD